MLTIVTIIWEIIGRARGLLVGTVVGALVLSGVATYNRLWHDPQVAAAARKDFVEREKLVAAQAERDELQRQININAQVMMEFERRQNADELHDDQVAADTEQRIANYKAQLRALKRKPCGLTKDDMKLLLR